MEIKVPVEELRKNKLFFATPMYGGQCAGMFARSIADLSALCTHYGIPLQFYFLFNESLITRARNYCVDEFMRSDATHLMFVDSDIGFNPKGGATSIPLGQPVEVLEIGTGFMMARKNTFNKFAEAFPQYAYRPDHVRTEHFDGTRKIMQYFQAEIDPKSERYLSEDYWFCQKVQEIGLKTWFCPWMQMQHVGTYIFGGSLADLASIGASATADPNNLGGKSTSTPKKKKK